MVAGTVERRGVTELLADAVGGDDPDNIERAARRYRDDPTVRLLVAVSDDDVVGLLGYCTTPDRTTMLHIATSLTARRSGVATALLDELRQQVPPHCPIVAETDAEAVGFYRSNGFTVTSLGEKYPGVERFHVVREGQAIR